MHICHVQIITDQMKWSNVFKKIALYSNDILYYNILYGIVYVSVRFY